MLLAFPSYCDCYKLSGLPHCYYRSVADLLSFVSCALVASFLQNFCSRGRSICIMGVLSYIATAGVLLSLANGPVVAGPVKQPPQKQARDQVGVCKEVLILLEATSFCSSFINLHDVTKTASSSATPYITTTTITPPPCETTVPGPKTTTTTTTTVPASPCSTT